MRWPVVSGIFDDVKSAVVTPSTLLRVLPFVGWPALFLDMYQGWGFLGKAAEVAIHAAPGIVQGDSISDALIADYGTRLKIAAGVMLGGALSSLSVEVSSALGTGGVEAAEAAARKAIGDENVDRIKGEIEKKADETIVQPFKRMVGTSDLQAQVGDLKRAGNLRDVQTADASAVSAPALARRFGTREDVAALALNTLAHERIYGVTPQSYDPATGARIIPIDSDRSSGPNSAWRLIDLLDAQHASAPADQTASLEADYRRALEVEKPDTHATSADVLIEVLDAQKRSAAPGYVADLEDKFEKARKREGIDAARGADAAATAAASEVRRAAALRGDLGLALAPDVPPTFSLAKGRVTVGAFARQALTAGALVGLPAILTWFLLRRR